MTDKTTNPTRNDEDDDDVMRGRILPRREVLALFGSAAGAAVMVACSGDSSPAATPTSAQQSAAVATSTQATGSGSTAAAASTSTAVPSCVVVPELTEGPYFIDEGLNRSDIRSDPTTGTIKPGTQLNLTFNVSQVTAGGCIALPDAQVDIWQCDAQGNYPGFAQNAGGSTLGQKFLRGYQDTDASGKASFVTIYPGWYQGRTVHIHFKIRTNSLEFTSQLFFDDTLSDQIFTQAAYQKNGNRILNTNDSIYRQGGDVLKLQLTRNGDAYNATFDIGLRV